MAAERKRDIRKVEAEVKVESGKLQILYSALTLT
jgi:hypothetical protein